VIPQIGSHTVREPLGSREPAVPSHDTPPNRAGRAGGHGSTEPMKAKLAARPPVTEAEGARQHYRKGGAHGVFENWSEGIPDKMRGHVKKKSASPSQCAGGHTARPTAAGRASEGSTHRQRLQEESRIPGPQGPIGEARADREGEDEA